MIRECGPDGQIGLEETPEIFIARLVAVFREVHRVLRNDGALSGYRWGVERKQALLEREGGKST